MPGRSTCSSPIEFRVPSLRLVEAGSGGRRCQKPVHGMSGSASPCAIARAGASPQPIRLGHLLSRLAACAGWSCLRRGGFLPVPPGTSAPGFDSLSRSSPPGDPLPCGRGFRGQGRLTRTPAKGNAIRCTRGAFHRRIAPAGARLALPKLSPACGVATPAPFSFLPPPGPLTRLRGARGIGRAPSATGFKSRARRRYDRSASRRLLRSVRSAARDDC
jgi:hypothetical protein